ncbi:MAG: hypothetical protein JSU79_04855 [Dehalococcoidales bacterium]|nr:MAG: hypothetical protein JSU79_04855 [Dehalococcoidales bacterium]
MRAKTEAAKDISRSDHFVGLSIGVFSILMLSYYIAHDLQSTGFFTPEFRTVERFLLYGSLVFWIITSSLDAIFNRRFLSRLIDTFGGVLFVCIGFAWLFIVFPFEMTYFADLLPESLRFLVQWISNDVAKVILGLGFIIHFVAAIYCPFGYKFVEKNPFKRN